MSGMNEAAVATLIEASGIDVGDIRGIVATYGAADLAEHWIGGVMVELRNGEFRVIHGRVVERAGGRSELAVETSAWYDGTRLPMLPALRPGWVRQPQLGRF